MQKRVKMLTTILITVVFLAACSGGGSAGTTDPAITGGGGGSAESDFLTDPSTLPAAAPATYREGTPVILTEATIGDQGGTLTGPAGTPLEGVVVTVPAGALTEPTTLSLGYDNGTFTNVKPEEQTSVIVLRSSGATTFQKPLEITYPFTDPNRVPVPYYINPDGTLEIVHPLPLDRAAGRGGFITWHASNFTRLNSDGSDIFHFNGFVPALDGFPIDNKIAVKYAPGGRCYGMTNFSKWYKKRAGGGLAGKFLYSVGTAVGAGERSGQEIIATRAHNSVAYYERGRTVTKGDNPEIRSFIIAVKNALSTGAPGVMVALGTEEGGAHAVLAVAYTDNQIGVYDPNHPGEFKAIDYTLDPPKAVYGDLFTYFGVFGGELPLNESYEHLLQDAEVKFHGENETKIEVTSHQDGQKVSSKEISLEGRIHSGQVLISELEAQVFYEDGSNSDPITLPMPPDDDTFALLLTLKKGNNDIYFKTKGYVAYLGTLYIIHDPVSFSLVLPPQEAGTSSLTVSSTDSANGPDGNSATTYSYSGDYTYRVNPLFDYSKCDFLYKPLTPLSDYCWLLIADPAAPMSVDYHYEAVSIDAPSGITYASQTDNAGGKLSCSRPGLILLAEPGGTPTNHTFRLAAGSTDVCPVGAKLTEYEHYCDLINSDCDDFVLEDSIDLGYMESRSLYTAAKSDSDIPACVNPPRIQSSDIEPWIEDPNAPPKTWTLTSGSNCQDGAYTETENTKVTLTLVP